MLNNKFNYSYKIEISETIELCEKQNVFRNHIFNIYIYIYIYIYKKDLDFNNLQ